MGSKKISSTFAILLVVGVFMLYFFFNPSEHSFFPKCPFKFVCGYKCPGCGSQQATHQLLHGNIGSAFKLNQLLILSIPLVIYEFGLKAWNYLFSKNHQSKLFTNNYFILAYCAIVILFWVFRNINGA